MTRTYTKHIAGEIIEGVQRCILCGFEICNTNNAMVYPPLPAGESLKGWAEGDFYISDGCPQMLQSEEPIGEEIVNCV